MAHVADHLSVSALEQQYRSCTDVTAARHFQTIWLLAKGHEIAEVADGVVCAALGGTSARPLQRPGSAGSGRSATPERDKPLRPEARPAGEAQGSLLEPPPDGGLVDQPESGGLDGGRTRARCGVAPTWLGGAQSDQLVGAEAPPPPSASATPEEREAFKKSSSRPSLRREPSTRTRRSKSGPRTNTASA